MSEDIKTYGRTVVIHSGGLDSTTLLYWILPKAEEVHSLSFYYGQKHQVELEHAELICRRLGVHHRRLELKALHDCLAEGSALVDKNTEIPHGHYVDECMKVTVVPNRNAIMICVAAAYAMSRDFDTVAYAAHAGDHIIYPDCRPEFVEAMRQLLRVTHFEPMWLVAPFVELSKADIVAIGKLLAVPYEMTYSCYEGGERHCGRCGTDTERKESFRLARVPDPTDYEDEKGAYRG